MAIPKGYRPIGRKYMPDEFGKAKADAKKASKMYGDSYIVRPVKSGKNILYYQTYWKRGR